MRIGLLCLPLALFLYYAGKDNSFHFRKPEQGGRHVPRAEHILHGVLGLLLVGLISAAFRLDPVRLPIFAGLFAVAGATDELGFHRGLPAEESDLHAKEHFALMVFLLTAWVTAALPVPG